MPPCPHMGRGTDLPQTLPFQHGWLVFGYIFRSWVSEVRCTENDWQVLSMEGEEMEEMWLGGNPDWWWFVLCVGRRFVWRDHAERQVQWTAGSKNDHRPVRGTVLSTQPQCRSQGPQTREHSRTSVCHFTLSFCPCVCELALLSFASLFFTDIPSYLAVFLCMCI